MTGRIRGRAARPAAALLLSACAALAGCVSEQRARRPSDPRRPQVFDARPKQRPVQRPTPRAARTPSAGRPDDPASPCATRLHDLGGMLLHYYALNRQLPDRLEDVAPLADAGVEFRAECPQSGRPYEYAPGGLSSSTVGGMLVLYDAAPVHGGLRWGVFLTPPGPERQAPATRVILMSDEVFRSFAPARP